MPKVIKNISISLFFLMIFSVLLFYITEFHIFLTLAITFGIFFYQITMRLIIGKVYNSKMKNQADYQKKHYQVGVHEQNFYKKLQIRKWKKFFPSYRPDLFNPKSHSWDEIVMATCQSEVIHETIFILSFLPIFLSIWFGDFFVFFLTSLLASIIDLSLVFIQRYNRARILRLMKKHN